MCIFLEDQDNTFKNAKKIGHIIIKGEDFSKDIINSLVNEDDEIGLVFAYENIEEPDTTKISEINEEPDTPKIAKKKKKKIANIIYILHIFIILLIYILIIKWKTS